MGAVATRVYLGFTRRAGLAGPRSSRSPLNTAARTSPVAVRRSTVDRHHRAADIGRARRRQESHDVGGLAGLAHPPERQVELALDVAPALSRAELAFGDLAQHAFGPVGRGVAGS